MAVSLSKAGFAAPPTSSLTQRIPKRHTVTHRTRMLEATDPPGNPMMDEDDLGGSRLAKRSRSPPSEEETCSKRKPSRKSARRSSFVRGRISNIQGVQLTDLSSDLLKDIQSDLPPEEKLKRLTMSALQFTLGRMSAEFPDVDGLQQLQVKVQDTASTSLDTLTTDGIFAQAAELSVPASDPLSIAINQAIQESKSLELEVTQWGNVLDQRKDETEKAKTEASYTEPIVAPLAYYADLPSGPSLDYKDLLDRNAKTKMEIELMVDELQKGVHGLKSLLEFTTDYLQTKAEHIRKVSFQAMSDHEKPERIIHQLVSI